MPHGAPAAVVGEGRGAVHRPRTSCVRVPDSRLKYPLLLESDKGALLLACADPEAG